MDVQVNEARQQISAPQVDDLAACRIGCAVRADAGYRFTVNEDGGILQGGHITVLIEFSVVKVLLSFTLVFSVFLASHFPNDTNSI